MSDLARDSRIRHRRTHDRLFHDATCDPIFLLQERRFILYPSCGWYWDSDREVIVTADGEELSEEEAVRREMGQAVWHTVTVFLTREDGEEYARQRAYRYPHGWRVFCVAASGDLVHVLAEATLEGRYA